MTRYAERLRCKAGHQHGTTAHVELCDKRRPALKCDACGKSYRSIFPPSVAEVLRPLCPPCLADLRAAQSAAKYPGWTREEYREAKAFAREAADMDRQDRDR